MEDPGELYILLTNRFDGFIQERDGTILSSRENGHGSGLSSIRATAEKYHGVALFEYKEQEFSASIMLKLTTGNFSLTLYQSRRKLKINRFYIYI